MKDEIVNLLSRIKEQNVYVLFNPEIFDFTNKDSTNEIIVFLQDGNSISFLLDDQNLSFIISILKISIFAKGMKVLTWDWKNLCSFILSKTKKNYLIEASVIDLKIIESYLGKKQKPPKSLNEALLRLKSIVSDGSWKEIENIYKKIHIPLITSVIPHLENSGIINVLTASKVHAFYEIGGQENGRLRCCNAFKNGFVPHAMKPELKENLKPRDFNEFFLVFDFRAMEVFMLSWLSKDPLLEELCKEPDIYYSLYDKLMGSPPKEKKDREIVKKMFLPVIYGQSSYMLGQHCNIPKGDADSIVDRINSLFPTALKWIKIQQDQLQNLGYAKDVFGKRRSFEQNKEYLVRNFSIQAPAAVLCLEKLNHLYYSLHDKTDLAYTVHDGYAVYANKNNWEQIFHIGKEVLCGPSELCPDLKLKVTCRGGRNLNDLKLIKK
jgi:hypothetical protein